MGFLFEYDTKEAFQKRDYLDKHFNTLPTKELMTIAKWKE